MICPFLFLHHLTHIHHAFVVALGLVVAVPRTVRTGGDNPLTRCKLDVQYGEDQQNFFIPRITI